MNRRLNRLLPLLLCLLILFPAMKAGAAKVPSRDDFSLGYARLQAAIRKWKPVRWSATVSPDAAAAVPEGATDALRTLFSALEFSGVAQCFSDGGGWLEASAMSGGTEIAKIGQMEKDGRIGLNLNGNWISTAEESQSQAVAMLTLDDLGQSLLSLNYKVLRSGDVPFLTPITKYAKRLWELASPYSEDNNRLRVSSGATGHGTSYSIDTAAARDILSKWADELSANGLSLGIAGSGMSIGVSQEAMEGFLGRLRRLAETIEVTKPITFNMAFGEGDLMGNAKGSGTIKDSEGKANVSYSYSCSQSSTRITRKYNLDFQPKQGDTIVLKLTTMTSSNNKSSGAQEISLDMSGRFDGKPYRIKLNTEMVNKYAVGDGDMLAEQITGALKATVEYDGVLVADIAVERTGSTQSAANKQAVSVDDTYQLDIKDDKGTLFRGKVNLSFGVDEEAQQSPAMKSTQYIEKMDFIEIEELRGTLQEKLADVKQNLIAAIAEPMQALFGAY